ncbi:MAG: ATP-binding protein [Chloroflexota bacterium]|nr:ATP-binding protein [Chloroflexota bacterium]
MTSPRLLIMCGLPFSGKSTLARELAARLRFVHLELDAVNVERGAGLDGGVITREDWLAAYRESYRRLDGLLNEGCSVVFDATNFRRAHRERLRRAARRAGAVAMVVYLDMPESETRDRLLRNRAAPLRYDVRDEDFAQVAVGFQPPGEDENVVRCDPTVSVAAVVARLRSAGLEGTQQAAPLLTPRSLGVAKPPVADLSEYQEEGSDVQKDEPRDRRPASSQR